MSDQPFWPGISPVQPWGPDNHMVNRSKEKSDQLKHAKILKSTHPNPQPLNPLVLASGLGGELHRTQKLVGQPFRNNHRTGGSRARFLAREGEQTPFPGSRDLELAEHKDEVQTKEGSIVVGLQALNTHRRSAQFQSPSATTAHSC